MSRIDPAMPDGAPELDSTMQHFMTQLGYIPTNMLILARVPRIAHAMAQVTSALWHPSSEVEKGLKRLCACTAGKVHGSKYSTAHAAESAHRAGVPVEKIAALDDYATSPLFSDAERVALEFAAAAAAQPNAVTDDMFRRMRGHWRDTQIVEIAAVVAANGFLNRWNDTIDATLEEQPRTFFEQHLQR